MSETIEEQRKVEGFGDPQYTCDPLELEIRRACYAFFQRKVASGELEKLILTQDWAGNTLHLAGSFRPMELASDVAKAVRPMLPKRRKKSLK
jgi:hypothetical protein